MSAVAKSESLIYRDARQYCQRRHQKTMGKCAREERQNDALLGRKLRHIQKSKSYRERELDREQEKCLTDLVTIFDRQCQIATTRLARRLKDALGDSDGLWGEKTESGLNRKLFKKQTGDKQLAKPNNGFFNSWDQHRSFPSSRGGKGSPSQKYANNRQLPSKSLNDLITSRSNFLRRDNFSGPDSPRPWQRIPASVQPTTPTPSLNQQYIFRNQIGIRESAGLNNPSRGSIRRRPIHRPKTAPPTRGLSLEATRRWNELASPIRCPQHCKDTSSHGMPKARSLRCLRDECTKKTEETILDAPEDVCFRRQYLACAMSRKLPVSGLKSGSFAQQDEVRKKMDGRRRCMEELRINSRQRSKSAPAGVVRMPDSDKAKC